MRDNNDQSFSILIVDDEPRNIQLIGNLLRDNNYETEFATNGKQALEWIYATPFDLVLLDIMMPEMDGYEVCRKIKSDSTIKHIPVIFLTARDETEDILKGFESGGADYITKPFKPPELLARVKKEVELKILRGLIPICASCKSIRDRTGRWNQLEAYIQNHSLALFSHGMCPECIERLYGDQDWYVEKHGKN